MKRLLCKTVLSLSVLASASAFAADGYVTGDVYLRAGPDPGYPSVAMLNAGTPVAIEGCVNGWSWCDVDAGGNRGWVAGEFLQDDYRGQRVLVPQYGVEIGIPIISFVFATYWQDHYRNRSWYSQRQRWSEVRPRYQTVVVQQNVRDNSRASAYENSRGTPNTYSASHNAAPRTRNEPNRPTMVSVPARSVRHAEPARTATPQRPVAMNVQPVRQANHAIPVAHNAASPRAEAMVSHQATQRPVTVARHQQATRPEAQQKKPAQKSKQDKNKRPDSSGQH
jgi:uncharacterized protein YraI